MEIWELTESEIAILANALRIAQESNRRFRFCLDNGLKVKVGEGMWTYQLGHKA